MAGTMVYGGEGYCFPHIALEATDTMRANAVEWLTPRLLLQAGDAYEVLTACQAR